MKKLKAGILGATGMVGQRLVTLLKDHPWFEVAALAASPQSAGMTYADAVSNRWHMASPIPERAAGITVQDASKISAVSEQVDFVFSAVSLGKAETLALEEAYARAELPVISNNSSARMLPDVPMLIPEINSHHTAVIPAQRRRLHIKHGFIAVKCNCSIQSYVPALTPLMAFEPRQIMVSTFQAVSGAGRVLKTWPEMEGNLIPFIRGEEEKSQEEPLKIWGQLNADASAIIPAAGPPISAQCIRVPVSDGHLATVSVKFAKNPGREAILDRWANFHPLAEYGLPSSPPQFLIYLDQQDRPQPVLDVNAGRGMAISLGRLREDPVFDWRFVCLSHNTLRGAAGGSILSAELLLRQGYLTHQEESS
ncbi:MAG: aspartate-semialdehyde dehydrogenase [Eubacteriales bacterium]|nr:aspartate-semialdehyde dehydrogenase [Eubacteriales bacterium]